MSGTVWMFSDQIDDEDIDFMHREFVTYNMASIYYGLGMKPVIRMSHECGAIYKIGRKVLIRRNIFEEYPACTTLHSKQKTCSLAMLTKNPPRTPPKRVGSPAFFISCFLIDRPTA